MVDKPHCKGYRTILPRIVPQDLYQLRGNGTYDGGRGPNQPLGQLQSRSNRYPERTSGWVQWAGDWDCEYVAYRFLLALYGVVLAFAVVARLGVKVANHLSVASRHHWESQFKMVIILGTRRHQVETELGRRCMTSSITFILVYRPICSIFMMPRHLFKYDCSSPDSPLVRS